MDPATFHFTDHYRDYPIVLARVAAVDPAWLTVMLARRWRRAAPPKISRLHPRIPGESPA